MTDNQSKTILIPRRKPEPPSAQKIDFGGFKDIIVKIPEALQREAKQEREREEKQQERQERIRIGACIVLGKSINRLKREQKIVGQEISKNNRLLTDKERELEELTLFSNMEDSQSVPTPLPERSSKKSKARRRRRAADIADALGKIRTIEQNRQKMKRLREDIENLKRKSEFLEQRSENLVHEHSLLSE